MIQFEWDENKNNKNIEKHHINFNEAATVFLDENALIIADDSHSDNEERFIIIGMSLNANLLIVCHCYRNNGNVIRIISARKATKNESRQYVEVNKI